MRTERSTTPRKAPRRILSAPDHGFVRLLAVPKLHVSAPLSLLNLADCLSTNSVRLT